jgi:hypothetical protein
MDVVINGSDYKVARGEEQATVQAVLRATQNADYVLNTLTHSVSRGR